MSLKSFIAIIIKRFLGRIGIDAYFFRHDKAASRVIFDRNYLSRYYRDDGFLTSYKQAMQRSGSEARDSFAKQARYYSIYQMVRHVIGSNVPGDFTECGCWQGHSTYMIAALLRDLGDERRFHVFDSFEGGLPEKTEEDKDMLAVIDPEAIKKESRAFFSTKAQVAANLAEFDFVELHKGWIPDSLVVAADTRFAFINLDLDLFDPIKESLTFFYPRLNDGGVIVVDDYGTTDWPGVKKAVDEFVAENRMRFSIETLGSFIILK